LGFIIVRSEPGLNKRRYNHNLKLRRLSVPYTAAREEWGWAPAYDLDAMTQDMLEKLKKKYEEGTLPEMG
jgi:nucleoside-diphosphate-sugar epimerase